MIKTTFKFEPSVDATKIVAKFGYGHKTAAYYGVRWAMARQGEDRPTEQPALQIQYDATEFTIEAPEGAMIDLLHAFVNEDGIASQANQMTFQVRPLCLPASPGQPTMSRVERIVPLVVIDAAKLAPAKEEQNGGVWVQVSGHGVINEGAIGWLVEVADDGGLIVAFTGEDNKTGNRSEFHLYEHQDGNTDRDYFAIVLVDTPTGRLQVEIDDFVATFRRTGTTTSVSSYSTASSKMIESNVMAGSVVE